MISERSSLHLAALIHYAEFNALLQLIDEELISRDDDLVEILATISTAYRGLADAALSEITDSELEAQLDTIEGYKIIALSLLPDGIIESLVPDTSIAQFVLRYNRVPEKVRLKVIAKDTLSAVRKVVRLANAA